MIVFCLSVCHNDSICYHIDQRKEFIWKAERKTSNVGGKRWRQTVEESRSSCMKTEDEERKERRRRRRRRRNDGVKTNKESGKMGRAKENQISWTTIESTKDDCTKWSDWLLMENEEEHRSYHSKGIRKLVWLFFKKKRSFFLNIKILRSTSTTNYLSNHV